MIMKLCKTEQKMKRETNKRWILRYTKTKHGKKSIGKLMVFATSPYIIWTSPWLGTWITYVQTFCLPK